MEQPRITHSTFVVERSFSKPPKIVFAAFADPAKARKWYAEGEGHELDEFTSDFRVGGRQTLRYRLGPGTPVAGMTINNQSHYHEIQPSRRIVLAQTMDLEDRRIMTAQVTVELLPSDNGTDLILTNQGAFFENGLTPEMLEAGWRGLLEKLARELEK